MKKIIVVVLSLLAGLVESYAQEAKLEDGLALKYLVQLPKEKTKHAPVIILLHGYGSDEKDLFALRAKFPKKYLVVAARAPLPIAQGGFQWFEISEKNNLDNPNKGQVGDSRRLILQFISQVISKYAADQKQVYLIGFSQGAIMSYEAGLTAPEEVKGIAALSGRMLPGIQRGITHKDEVKKLRIFIAHGTADNRIKFEDGKAADDFLKGMGVQPEFHEYTGMGHTISSDVLNDLVKWLK